MLWLWPGLTIDWPAILATLVAVLTPLVSITIPLAVHTVRQRGRLVAEYYSQTCRLNTFCGIAVAAFILGILSLICFRLGAIQTPGRSFIAIGPSIALGLTAASVFGLAYILFATLACTRLDGRLRGSRFLAARLAGRAIRGWSVEEELTLVYADLALLMADADLASFRALVRSLAQAPRCYTRFAKEPHGFQLDSLWGSHVDVMNHVVGRGAYHSSASKPGPIAARFAREHSHALTGEFRACIEGADPHNLAAATRTIRWFYGLLHSARGDQSLPREVSDALFELRGKAALYYSLPESSLRYLPSEAEAATIASLIQTLHRGAMDLLVEASHRNDRDVVSALSKGLAEFYPEAKKRLSDLGQSHAARLLAHDYWILVGRFVSQATSSVEGGWEVAMVLQEPFQDRTPLDLLNTFVNSPEPTWVHPVYAHQREARTRWITTNPITGSGSGAWCIGRPGTELGPAFAFLLAHAWRPLQPKPEVVPCPRELDGVKRVLDDIFATRVGWQLTALDRDKTTIQEWLDDCVAAHREIERQQYLFTPLSPNKTQEFEQKLRDGFWDSAVLLHHVPAVVSRTDDGGEMLRYWAIHGPRSLYFGDEPDPDVARFGHDAGVGAATFVHGVVVNRWCQTVTAPSAEPVGVERAVVEASDWLGPQGGWDGLIVVVGPYELKARTEALPDYQPHATQAEYSREFFGTHRGYPLLWLRTNQDDGTRQVYALRLSALRSGATASHTELPDLDRNVWPGVIFKEARDLVAEYREQSRDEEAEEVAKQPGHVYVMAELGYLSPAMPEGHVWELSETTGAITGMPSA